MSVRTILIGRGRGCDLLLTHSSISRRHAEISIQSGGALELRDLGSTGGTYLVKEGRVTPVTVVQVKPGDTVRFGEYDILVKDLMSLIPKQMAPAPAMPRGISARVEATPNVRNRMVRCVCGTVKERGKPCPDCGA